MICNATEADLKCRALFEYKRLQFSFIEQRLRHVDCGMLRMNCIFSGTNLKLEPFGCMGHGRKLLKEGKYIANN